MVVSVWQVLPQEPCHVKGIGLHRENIKCNVRMSFTVFAVVPLQSKHVGSQQTCSRCGCCRRGTNVRLVGQSNAVSIPNSCNATGVCLYCTERPESTGIC